DVCSSDLDALGLVPLAQHVVDQEAQEPQIGAEGAPGEAGLLGEGDAAVGDGRGGGDLPPLVSQAGEVEGGAQVGGEVVGAFGVGALEQPFGPVGVAGQLGEVAEVDERVLLGVDGPAGFGDLQRAQGQPLQLVVPVGVVHGAGVGGQGTGEPRAVGGGVDGGLRGADGAF